MSAITSPKSNNSRFERTLSSNDSNSHRRTKTVKRVEVKEEVKTKERTRIEEMIFKDEALIEKFKKDQETARLRTKESESGSIKSGSGGGAIKVKIGDEEIDLTKVDLNAYKEE